MSFHQKLDNSIGKNNSLLCVGLDPDFEKLPEPIKAIDNPQYEFNKKIINATHDLVCVYKLNPAFYEARGDKGILEMKLTIDYIKDKYPDVPVIVDAKRGDIGNSNNGYAQYAFDYLQADAMTVMPYLGIESLDPYFERKGKGIIVGCHSSNPGAKEFQERLVISNSSVILNEVKNPETRSFANAQDDKPKPLYEVVAAELVKQHGKNPNCMIFMGATYPSQLTSIRKIIGDMTILAPGVGAQGGTVETFVNAGKNSKNAGIMINVSRGIIFASSGKDFAEKARVVAEKFRDEINKFRA